MPPIFYDFSPTLLSKYPPPAFSSFDPTDTYTKQNMAATYSETSMELVIRHTHMGAHRGGAQMQTIFSQVRNLKIVD